MKTILLFLIPVWGIAQHIGDPKLSVYHEYKDTVITKYSEVDCFTYDTYPSYTVCDSIGQVPAKISRMYVLFLVEGEYKKVYLPEYERIMTDY